jgi:formylglycine-generating enzyme required for sulfatase activity
VPWKWATKYLRRAAPEQIDLEQLCTLARQADLLEFIGDAEMPDDQALMLRFIHQLIQEYFAALMLKQKIDRVLQRRRHMWLSSSLVWLLERELRRYAAPARRTGWEETLLLLAGIEGETGHAAELIRTFLSQPVQAARLLLASGEEVDPTLLEKVRQALIQTMANTQISVGRRVEAGKALGDLGDPRPGVCTLPPAMVRIEGGRFVIGNPKEQAKYDNEINDQPMTVATFELARYPITNAQYKLFIDNGGYEIDAPWWDEAAREWLQKQGIQEPQEWNDNRFGIARPNHPVVGISWYEAVAFCCWLTGYVQDGYVYRLPTEAEWEYAARRATRRVYPWGNEEPDGERANFNRTYEGTTAVGCFPQGATADGLHDLAGNVWEWTGSVYKPYLYHPQDGREDTSNPANKRFVMRGGGWYNRPIYLRASPRYFTLPVIHLINLGLRPARHLP